MTSDFWWLTGDQLTENWSVGVGHHEPLPDEFNEFAYRPSQEEPIFPHWWHSTAEDGEPSNAFKRYPLHFLETWRSRWNNRNVYRTLLLFPDLPEDQHALGPFLVDIDSRDWASQSLEDLDDTLQVTRQAVSFLTQSCQLTPERDFRVFFSGRKGFNIEAIPASLGITGEIAEQIRASATCLDTIIRELQGQNSVQSGNGSTVSAHGTSIDRIYGRRLAGMRFITGFQLKHPYTRLHSSINQWVSQSGEQVARRRLELTVSDLSSEGIGSIRLRAETSVSLAE